MLLKWYIESKKNHWDKELMQVYRKSGAISDSENTNRIKSYKE